MIIHTEVLLNYCMIIYNTIFNLPNNVRILTAIKKPFRKYIAKRHYNFNEQAYKKSRYVVGSNVTGAWLKVDR